MQPFLVMIGQIFLITCIQTIIEIFISDKKHVYMSKIVTIACYLGSLYIVIQFTYHYLFKELSNLFLRLM